MGRRPSDSGGLAREPWTRARSAVALGGALGPRANRVV